MLVDSALDGIIGLRVDNGNTKRRRSKLGTTALVVHQENDPRCLGFQVPCCSDSPSQSSGSTNLFPDGQTVHPTHTAYFELVLTRNVFDYETVFLQS